MPFSRAAAVGPLVFLSGQIGIDSQGNLAQGFEAQTHQTMQNIMGDLQAIGLGANDVLKCTVMLVDMADWPAFNAIYRGYFDREHLPARSALGVSALALDAKVEVECIAARPSAYTQPSAR